MQLIEKEEFFADVIAIRYDETKKLLISLYSDRTLFIWDISKLESVVIRRSFLNHSGTIHDIQILGNTSSYEVTFFATGGTDKTVRIWNLADQESFEVEGLRRNLYSKHISRIIYVGNDFSHFKVFLMNLFFKNK